MVNNYLVSIIVPVYNTEKFLKSALDSIKMQSYRNLEVLLINDGSTDDSGSICDSYAKSDKRIKVFHIDNHGVSYARNIGLQEAIGQYITFVDSDDTIAVNMIEELVNALDKYKCDCVIGGCNYVNNSRLTSKQLIRVRNHYVLKKQECLERLCYMNPPFDCIEVTAVWGKLYSKKILQGMQFKEDMSIGEDFVFNFKVLSRVSEALYVDFEGYNYFIRTGSAMRSVFQESKMQTMGALEELSNFKVEKNIESAYLSRLVNIAIVLLFMIPIESKYQIHRDRIVRFIKKYRGRIVLNIKTRFKVRVALMVSYLGFDNMQRLFDLIREKGIVNG